MLYDSKGELINYLFINLDNTDKMVAYNRIEEFEYFFTLVSHYAKVGYAKFDLLTREGYAISQWYQNMVERFVDSRHFCNNTDNIGDGRKPLIVFQRPYAIFIYNIDPDISQSFFLYDQRNQNKRKHSSLLQIHFFRFRIFRQLVQIVYHHRIKIPYFPCRPNQRGDRYILQ